MTSPRRARKSKSEWQTIINDQVESGMDVQTYCQSHKLSIENFRKWRRALKPGQPTFSDPFIEVPIDIASDSPGDVIGKRIELDLGNGMTLRVFS